MGTTTGLYYGLEAVSLPITENLELQQCWQHLTANMLNPSSQCLDGITVLQRRTGPSPRCGVRCELSRGADSSDVFTALRTTSSVWVGAQWTSEWRGELHQVRNTTSLPRRRSSPLGTTLREVNLSFQYGYATKSSHLHRNNFRWRQLAGRTGPRLHVVSDTECWLISSLGLRINLDNK